MVEIIQGSQQWFDIKRGKCSASHVVDIVPGSRGAYTAARKNYIAQLVLELLTGKTAETYQSAAMLRGIELEAEARIMYEAQTGAWVEQIGFIDHPDIPRFGASPDGLVDTDGGIEIKGPEAAQHLATIRGEAIKRDYLYQIQANLMCSVRKWWDYVSYHPDFPERLRLYIKRFSRDEVMIAEIAEEVVKANAEVDAALEELRKL